MKFESSAVKAALSGVLLDAINMLVILAVAGSEHEPMTWFAAPLVLALAVTSTQTPLPRMTHAEGLVAVDAAGVRTAGGRAGLVLAGVVPRPPSR
jgi:hypothetical protein